MELSGNLKRLRKERDMTQEELADLLGISFQAVSKWERGESYPDITLLPAIAGYFSVSIDELLGMTVQANKEKRGAVLKAWQKLVIPPDWSRAAAAEYLRKQMRNFQHDWELWLKLAFCLDGMFEAGLPLTTEADHLEAIEIYERILRFCVDDAIRMNALTGLARVYRNMGQLDKAVEAARKLPSYVNSQEHTLPALLSGEEQIQQYQFILTGITSWFMSITQSLALEDKFGYTLEERIRLLEKGIALHDLMTDSGDAPFLPGTMKNFYTLMANLSFEAGQPDRALAYLDTAADYALKWSALGREHQYTSVLLNRRNRNSQWALDPLDNPIESLLFVLTSRTAEKDWPALDPYRNDERLIRIIEKLTPYIENTASQKIP
jgi:transcriptional regulator with XRE-family HTH domain